MPATITLTDQPAFDNNTGDKVALTGDFPIVEFHKRELFTGQWTETTGHWTVAEGETTYSFSRAFPTVGRVDFGSATDYDLTNI
jgi:hypothetical protein